MRERPQTTRAPSEGLGAQEGAGGRETRAVLTERPGVSRSFWSGLLLALLLCVVFWALFVVIWFLLP